MQLWSLEPRVFFFGHLVPNFQESGVSPITRQEPITTLKDVRRGAIKCDENIPTYTSDKKTNNSHPYWIILKKLICQYSFCFCK